MHVALIQFLYFFSVLPPLPFVWTHSDITQRGRDLEGVLKQYSTMVKPAYSNYIAPTMAHADIIVPRGGDNKVAIQLIVQHVHTQLQAVIYSLKFVFFASFMNGQG